MCKQDKLWSESRYFTYDKMQELYDGGRNPEAATEAARKMITASHDLQTRLWRRNMTS